MRSISIRKACNCWAAGDSERPLRRITPTVRLTTGSDSGTLTSSGWSSSGIAMDGTREDST